MSLYTFKTDKYSCHMKIINYFKSSYSDKKIKILDIGCSKGFIGEGLHGSSFKFYGIEIDEEDAKIASKYYTEVKIADLDKEKIVYKKDFFDVMILNDVIEHLKSSAETASYFKPFLKKDGIMIISTGNVANLYIRLKLLFGNFDYEDRGILDRTHLKLFTLKTFRQLVHESGLKIIKEEFTPVPLPLVYNIFSEGMPLNIIHKISNFFACLLPELFCFEFIFYCKKEV